jgi:cytidine deaminase
MELSPQWYGNSKRNENRLDYFIVATKSNKKSPCSYCRGFLKSSASFE